MAGQEYTVFFDSGYHESQFEVTTVVASSAFAAAKAAAGDRDLDAIYYVCPTKDLIVVRQKKPTTPLWDVLSGEELEAHLERKVARKTKSPKVKRPK